MGDKEKLKYVQKPKENLSRDVYQDPLDARKYPYVETGDERPTITSYVPKKPLFETLKEMIPGNEPTLNLRDPEEEAQKMQEALDKGLGQQSSPQDAQNAKSEAADIRQEQENKYNQSRYDILKKKQDGGLTLAPEDRAFLDSQEPKKQKLSDLYK